MKYFHITHPNVEHNRNIMSHYYNPTSQEHYKLATS